MAPASVGSQGRRKGRVVAGRYDLLDLIGRGAMGEVWRAHHRTLRIDVAIKFLSMPRGDGVSVELERFRFEAQVAAQLGRKTQCIVVVHDVGDDEKEGPFLVMEYVRGRTLRQELDERGQMTPGRLLPLLEDITEALELAHGLGIVHRDIKPSNVLLVEEAGDRLRARIADFGIAKGISPELRVDLPRQTASELVVGTPAYMSPELFCDGRVDPKTDMWALAVVVYEALTGKKPFQGRNFGEVLTSIVDGPPPGPSTVCPTLPPALDAWFVRAFALDPAERFASVREMVDAFRAAAGITSAPAAEARAASRSWTRRALAMSGVAAAAAVVVLVAGHQVRGTAPATALHSWRAAFAAAAAHARLTAEIEQPRVTPSPAAAAAAGVPIAAEPAPSASATHPAATSAVQPAPTPAATQGGRAAPRGTRRADWKSTIF